MQKRPPHGENLALSLMLVCIVLQDFKAARIGLQSLLQTVKCQYQSLRYAVLHMFTQLLFWAGKMISKISTHPCYPWNFDWFSWERSKKKIWIVFFKMDNLKKLRFQKFSARISWIGPLISRIDWCKGHWCGSFYMVARLSGISSITA